MAPRIPEDGSGRTTPVGKLTPPNGADEYADEVMSVRAIELSRVYPMSVMSKPVMSTFTPGIAAYETLLALLARRNVNGVADASVVPGGMGTK